MRFLFALAIIIFANPSFAAEEFKNSFERVLKTQTLRCAYTIYPPFIIKDPNTGKFSGLFYDLTEEIGKQLNIKIEWVEEVGSDALFAGMGSRYDANCTGYFATPGRTFGGDFTKPLSFMPYNIYVRADDARFKNFDELNNENLTVVTLDGELSQSVAAEKFPKTKTLSQPGLTPPTDRLMAVTTGKGDFTLMEPAIAEEFMAANPGKLKMFGNKPIQVGGSVLVLPHNEFALKNMLDTTIDTMLWTGALDRIIAKHTKYKGSFLAPTSPYKTE